MNGATQANSPRHLMLSVIIPAYNAANTLGEQLEALKAQDYEGDWEIVVVDNRSTDMTVDLVRDYQRLMPYLRLVHALEKQGRAYACNAGAQSARGDAFIFCDADDVVAPGWLRALAEALEEHDLVAGVVEVDTLNRSAPFRPPPPNGAEQPILGFLPFVIGCNLAVSREAFEAVNGFSEEFPSSGDVEFTWCLQLRGYAIHDAPAAVVHYRYRETLRDLWKQYVRYGYYHPLLYRRFASHGMPRSSTRAALQQYIRQIRRGLRILLHRAEQQERSKWVYKTAHCWGRFWGSLRYRTLYL